MSEVFASAPVLHMLKVNSNPPSGPLSTVSPPSVYDGNSKYLRKLVMKFLDVS